MLIKVATDSSTPNIHNVFMSEPMSEEQLAAMTPHARNAYEANERLKRPLHPRVAALAPLWVRMHEMMDSFQDKDVDETISFIVAMMGGTYRVRANQCLLLCKRRSR